MSRSPPSPPKSAEVRRKFAGGLTNTGTSEAAKFAADGTSTRRRTSNPPKGATHHGTKEALPGPIPPKSAARHSRRQPGRAARVGAPCVLERRVCWSAVPPVEKIPLQFGPNDANTATTGPAPARQGYFFNHYKGTPRGSPDVVALQ
jgi:hypothetical protein